MNGNKKPSPDDIAAVIVKKQASLELLLGETRGTKKTKTIMMLLAAMANHTDKQGKLRTLVQQIDDLSSELQHRLLPESPDTCWGRGVAFSIALDRARDIVAGEAA